MRLLGKQIIQILLIILIVRYLSISKDKTVGASCNFKLKLIYKKIRGDLPEYYSYSKWNKIDIRLIDDSIAIVNANFSRYKEDDTIYNSGSAQYHMRLTNNEWKIFTLTPYTKIQTLN